MKLTNSSAKALAEEPGLTGLDLRVWLLLVDAPATSAELARAMNIAPTNTAASCRKLLYAGWVDLVEEIGRSKRYRARGSRDENAAVPGQTRFQF